MNWFNWYGFIIMVIIMIPNSIYAAKFPEGFENIYQNRIVLALEQIGRIGSFVFMVLQIPYLCKGYILGEKNYMLIVGLLCLIYCMFWIICWKQKGVFRAVVLSVTPSLMFLSAGILSSNIPLIISAIIFVPCHILISYKNVVLK